MCFSDFVSSYAALGEDSSGFYMISTATGKTGEHFPIGGKSQGILSRLEKSGSFTQTSGKSYGVLHNFHLHFCNLKFRPLLLKVNSVE